MRAPWTTDRPTAPQPITATRAPCPDLRRLEHRHHARSRRRSRSGTPARPAARAAPHDGDGSATTVRVANVPVRSTGVSSAPSARCSRPGAAGGRLHWRGSPRRHGAHAPHAVFQPSTTRSPAATTVDALADRLDRAGALVPEQDRQRVAPAVLLDHVQVAVADAGRLDPDEHLARARAARRRSPRARPRPARRGLHPRQPRPVELADRGARPRAPASGRSRPSGSGSAPRPRAARRRRARRRRAGRAARRRRRAPSPSRTSAARRMPPSIRTTASGSASRTSTSASSAATAPSTWRPPWFETMTPSMPCSSARRASSAVSTPFTSSGSFVCARSQSRSSHVSPMFGNVASIVAAAVSRSSSGVLSSFERKTGSREELPAALALDERQVGAGAGRAAASRA